jgi:hypothetical protein
MYVPSTDQEKQLFCLKQDFLFGVFVATMKVSQLHSVVKIIPMIWIHRRSMLHCWNCCRNQPMPMSSLLTFWSILPAPGMMRHHGRVPLAPAWLVPVGTSLTPLHRRFGTSSMTSLAKAIILGCDTDGCALPGKPPAAGCNHFHLAQGHNQMPYAPSDSLDVDARVDACIEAYIHDLGLTTNDYAVDGAALMTLLTNATKQCKTWSKPKASNLPASDLCKVLANAAMTLPAPPSEVNTNSVTHIAKLHAVYAVSAARCVHQGSLVDCGANGVVAGDDVHHIKEVADHCVHVQGIDDHQLMNIHLATVGGYLKKT